MKDYQCECRDCTNRTTNEIVIDDWTHDEWHDYDPRTVNVCDDCLLSALGWDDEDGFYRKRKAACDHKENYWNNKSLYVRGIDPTYEYCRACGDARKVAA